MRAQYIYYGHTVVVIVLAIRAKKWTHIHTHIHPKEYKPKEKCEGFALSNDVARFIH